MTENISIREFVENFMAGKYDRSDRKTQIEAGWYDWFCSDSSLQKKTVKLTKKLMTILKSDKIDQDKMYVFFKNNCPMNGSLYDDFRICDMETGEVVFTVIPASGHASEKGVASVWGRENGFDGPIVEGKWKDVKEYFLT